MAVYDGSSLVAQSDLVGAGGRWSVQLPDALAAGLHDLTARTLDVSGAVSAPSAALSLVINPPPLASPAAGEDPLAASIRSGISDLLSGGLVYAEAGQPEGSGAAGAAPALSIDDSTTDQLIQVPTGCAYVSDIASGPVTVFGADGGAPQAVSASGQIYYVAGEGSTVLLADQSIGGDVVFGSTSASSDLEAATGAGDDILVARSSDVSLSGGSGANQFWLGSGQADVDSDGADTIVAGSGAATVTGGADTISAADGHSDLVFGGSGTLWFSNLAGGSTVVGGAGSDTLFGGSGPTCFYGGSGGGNILIGGSGPSTLVGGGDGDLLYARGSGNDVLAAGGDNATLAGGSSTGNNLYFGGSGRNVIAAGAGADTIAGGSGQSTIFAGAGDDLVFGAAGGGVIVAGSGNATLVGGAGPELYAVFDGRAGGDVTIDGFRPGVDHLTLPDYSAQSVAASLLGQIDQAGSTQLLLSDGTTITFSGLSGFAGQLACLTSALPRSVHLHTHAAARPVPDFGRRADFAGPLEDERHREAVARLKLADQAGQHDMVAARLEPDRLACGDRDRRNRPHPHHAPVVGAHMQLRFRSGLHLHADQPIVLKRTLDRHVHDPCPALDRRARPDIGDCRRVGACACGDKAACC